MNAHTNMTDRLQVALQTAFPGTLNEVRIDRCDVHTPTNEGPGRDTQYRMGIETVVRTPSGMPTPTMFLCHLHARQWPKLRETFLKKSES